MPAPSQAEIDSAKTLSDTSGYAKASGFDSVSLAGFSPEVQAALKSNETGQKNLVVGGQLVTKDPGFTFTPVVAPGTSQTTTTSDPVRKALDSLNTGITSSTTKPLNVPFNGATYNDAQSFYTAREKELQQRKDDEIARLTKEFDAAQVSQGDAQRKETGTSSMGLARIGGFDSASGQAVLTNLERVHVQEQQALISKRQAAITQAQQAYEDKDFALAESQLKEAKDAEQKIYDRQKDFVNLTLQYKQDQRSDLQFQFQKSQADKVDARAAVDFALQHGIDKPFYVAGGVGYDSSTGEKLSYEEFIKRGGKPDFSNAHLITPGSEEDRAFVAKMRETYPDAGIVPTDTTEQATAKIKKSAIYRKDTYIAPVGGYTGAKTAAQSKILTDAASAFDASKGSDGYIDPNLYRQKRREYIAAGGSPSDFYAVLAVGQYIAPTNRKEDLTGTSAEFKQTTSDNTQARLDELLAKAGGGQDLGKLNFSELAELKKLLGQ